MDLSELKDEYKLEYTHDIILQDGMPTFKKIDGVELSERASVYVWFSKAAGDNDVEILYVGKAGYGVKKRFSQHRGGFKNSVTGRDKKEKLVNELNSGKEVIVCTRICDEKPVLGEKVSMYSVEEDALCRALNPKWNVGGFPEIHDNVISHQKELHDFLNQDLVKYIKDDQMEDVQDEVMSYLDNVSDEAISSLYEFVKYARENVAKNCFCKLVRGYSSGQPEGCNQIPMLVYAKGLETKIKANDWVVRIALSDKPRIIFPDKYLSEKVKSDGRVEIIEGTTPVFSPIDTENFLKNIVDYISE